MKIGDREIGINHPPYIVAEIGANHGGDLGRALRLIEAAKAARADAVKFQCYTADTITIDSNRPEFMLTEGPWRGQTLHDLYKRAETPFDWFPKLAEHAQKCRIDWFASAFDESAVDLLNELDCPAIKVASFEIVDTPLIRYAASTGRPLIISTGMASFWEVEAAVQAAEHDAGGTMLLHCVSGYPTPIEEAGLIAFRALRAKFWGQGCEIGISDHTLGAEVPIAATALGAAMIEKHFRLGWRLTTEQKPADFAFSMEPVMFGCMADSVRKIWTALQSAEKPRSEQPQSHLRRSLYAVADIAAGEPFTRESVRSIRPGAGLPPAMLDEVLERKATRDIARGTPLSQDLLG